MPGIYCVIHKEEHDSLVTKAYLKRGCVVINSI